LNYAAISVDNVQISPVLKVDDWNGTSYMPCFIQLLKTLRALGGSTDVDMTPKSFKSGPLTLFSWDLSADHSDASPCRKGVTSMEFHWSQPTPTSGLTGVVFASFPYSTVTIDKHRNVTVCDRID
jgi:hypothetical protein